MLLNVFFYLRMRPQHSTMIVYSEYLIHSDDKTLSSTQHDDDHDRADESRSDDNEHNRSDEQSASSRPTTGARHHSSRQKPLSEQQRTGIRVITDMVNKTDGNLFTFR
jgi:hypothetical protein